MRGVLLWFKLHYMDAKTVRRYRFWDSGSQKSLYVQLFDTLSAHWYSFNFWIFDPPHFETYKALRA